MIHQVAAFIAGNHKTAGRGAVKRTGGTGGFTHHEGGGRGRHQVIQRLGADRTQKHVHTVRASRFGAFHQRVPVFAVAEVDQRVLQPDTVILAEQRSSVFRTISPKSSSSTMPDF